MKHLLDDDKNYSKQKAKSQKLCNEKKHLPLSLKETFWGSKISSKEQDSERCSRKVNNASKVVSNRKIITGFTRYISSIRIGLPVFMAEVSKDKSISREVIRDEALSITVSETLHKER